MNSEATITISGAVVALTQFVKWAGLPDRWGPLAVLVLSALGVLTWAYSVNTYVRADTFSYFAAWVNVTIGAAGIFGFTRASSSSLTAIREGGSSGAGGSVTTK